MPSPDYSKIIHNRDQAFTEFSTNSHTVYNKDGTLVSGWAARHKYQYVLPPLSLGSKNSGDYYTQGSQGMRVGFDQFGLTCDDCYKSYANDKCNWKRCHCENDNASSYRLLLWRTDAASHNFGGKEISRVYERLPSLCRTSSDYSDGDIPQLRGQDHWTTGTAKTGIDVGGVKCDLKNPSTATNEKSRLNIVAVPTEASWYSKLKQGNHSITGSIGTTSFTNLADVVGKNNNKSGSLLGVDTSDKSIPTNLSSLVVTPTPISNSSITVKGVTILTKDLKSPDIKTASVSIPTNHVPNYLKYMSTKDPIIEFIRNWIASSNPLDSSLYSSTFGTMLDGAIIGHPTIDPTNLENGKAWFVNRFNEVVHSILKEETPKINTCFTNDAKLIEFEVAGGLIPGLMDLTTNGYAYGYADKGIRFFIDENYDNGAKQTLTVSSNPIFKHIVKGQNARGMPSTSEALNHKLYIDSTSRNIDADDIKKFVGHITNCSHNPDVASRPQCTAAKLGGETTVLFTGTLTIPIKSKLVIRHEDHYLNAVRQVINLSPCCAHHGTDYGPRTRQVNYDINLGAMVEVPFDWYEFNVKAIKQAVEDYINQFYDKSGSGYVTTAKPETEAWSWTEQSETFIKKAETRAFICGEDRTTKPNTYLYRLLGENRTIKGICGMTDNSLEDCRCSTGNKGKDEIRDKKSWAATSDWCDIKGACDLVLPNDRLEQYGTIQSSNMAVFIDKESVFDTDHVTLEFTFKVGFKTKMTSSGTDSNGLCPFTTSTKCYHIPNSTYSKWVTALNSDGWKQAMIKHIKNAITYDCLVMHRAYERLRKIDPVVLYENPFNAVMMYNDHNVGFVHNYYYSISGFAGNGYARSSFDLGDETVKNIKNNYLDTVTTDFSGKTAVEGPSGNDVAIVIRLPDECRDFAIITRYALNSAKDLDDNKRYAYVTTFEKKNETISYKPANELLGHENVLVITPFDISKGNSATRALTAQLVDLGSVTVPMLTITEADKIKTFEFGQQSMKMYMHKKYCPNESTMKKQAIGEGHYVTVDFNTNTTQDQLKYIVGGLKESSFK